jgi:hypothetical protein
MLAPDFRRAILIMMSRISMFHFIPLPTRTACRRSLRWAIGHTHEFTAAIQTAGALEAARDPRAAVDEFLKEATNLAAAIL